MQESNGPHEEKGLILIPSPSGREPSAGRWVTLGGEGPLEFDGLLAKGFSRASSSLVVFKVRKDLPLGFL